MAPTPKPGAFSRARKKYNARTGNSPTAQKLKPSPKTGKVVRKAAQRSSSMSVKKGRTPLSDYGKSSVNRVTSGAGSQRQGKRYQVKTDSEGNYYHVYGRGTAAKRVKLSSDVASAYGYNKPGGESIQKVTESRTKGKAEAQREAAKRMKARTKAKRTASRYSRGTGGTSAPA